MTADLTTFAQRLTEPAPGTTRDDPDALRRRRIVVAVFVVIGAIILGFSLSAEPGAASFVPMTIALAAAWLIGGFLSGPIRLGRFGWRPPESETSPKASTGSASAVGAAALGIAVGLAVGAAFVLGALITREIEVLASLVRNVLAFRDEGSVVLITAITLGNGLAEEIFFRGAVYSAVQKHQPLIWSTLLYALVTLASGNVMLGFAAIVLGSVCAVLRRATDGVLAAICTHVIWGAIILFCLPPIFGT
ncbi:type II CAAX endopeptidase family protein [Gordonia sp. Z-3]|uniref:CPBP family intramembrane metalloprotease n=1 Tax=Gordonia tangerina TaxID=2911060 RepID=A0ABS9DNR8_9ACTN|nr:MULTISPECIES: type II CAAX endopeptidase family protein [Gordonia]MAU82416.1 CPBP family intramembrane metalloprotease [Gordonia sp. (in: high G+C Gram-positive bacteria)]MCF3939601.1 CPBP family intramembrane metalloprotease [Gordonia tangerina]MED5802736.1 type II CAAX endopeptidase family protein [Gordonia sp. Z-3]